MTFVYFIRPVGCVGPIKVGHSIRPRARLVALMAGAPFQLEIVAEVEGGLYLEMQFHALFRPHHSHSEWFHAAPEVVAVVEAVRKGTFDLSTLPSPQRVSGTSKGSRWSARTRANIEISTALRRLRRATGVSLEDHARWDPALTDAEYAAVLESLQRQIDETAPQPTEAA